MKRIKAQPIRSRWHESYTRKDGANFATGQLVSYKGATLRIVGLRTCSTAGWSNTSVQLLSVTEDFIALGEAVRTRQLEIPIGWVEHYEG